MISPKLAFNFDNHFPTLNGIKILSTDSPKLNTQELLKVLWVDWLTFREFTAKPERLEASLKTALAIFFGN